MENIFQSNDFADFHMNACVGKNTGGISQYSYMQGFSDAFFALYSVSDAGKFIDPDTQEEKYANIDGLIYPIAYCARHHIELFIKHQIAIIDDIKPFLEKEPIGHGLIELFEILNSRGSFDRRIKELLDKIRPFIEIFSKIDPKGQTFRYALDKEGDLHLGNINILNAASLNRSFKSLSTHIEELNILTPLLIAEYQTGTYTKKLSRYDIEVIAQHLPHNEKWGQLLFNNIKNKVMSTYAISGREFSEVLNIIKKHREFSPFIGIENKIEFLTEDLAKRLSRTPQDGYEIISNEEWRSLYAVCEIGQTFNFSESFESLLNSQRSSFIGPQDVYRDITSKSHRFQNGLIKLGQHSFIMNLEIYLPQIIKHDAKEHEITKKWKFVIDKQD